MVYRLQSNALVTIDLIECEEESAGNMKLSELLGLQIKKNPVGFSQTPYGKALTAGFNMVPSSYATADYKLSDSK